MTVAINLPRSTPEAQGISSTAVKDFVDAADREIRDLHSFILLRHGAVVAEGYWGPYGPTLPHMLFSLSKSFTSTAIGLLVAEGRLTVDDKVLSFFPEDAPADVSDNLKSMRVKDLLTMTTGHHVDATPALRQTDSTWTRAFFAQPVEHQPGTHFVYNSAATYMLSAIAQRLTGERIVHYLQPRLFGPLGIENPTWETSPEGIDTGGWGLSITTRDIASFGQLYLQGGIWQGTRILPAAWVKDATSRQVNNAPSPNPDWEQGYGYQFWRSRHGAYRGDGAFGQFCVVLPEQDAVLAITAGVGNMQSVLDLVWKHLLPALGSDSAVEDRAGQKALADRLATLRLAPTAGRSESSRSGEWSGRRYVVAENSDKIEAIRFDFSADVSAMTVQIAGNEQRVRCGYGRWEPGEVTMTRGRAAAADATAPTKVASSGAWADDMTYVVDLWLVETPFRRTFTFHFDSDRITVDQKTNVSFGPSELPRLEGRASA